MSRWIAPLALGGWLALSPLAMVGCSGEDEVAAPREDLEADARALALAMLEDPARLPLEEVDEAFRDDRPVLAADLIAQGARPATERQIETLRALTITSAEGRRLRSRCVRLYRARVEALEGMREVLSRGTGQEDEALVRAMHADAEAQVALVAFQEELARLAPIEGDERPPLEQRGAPPRLPSREEGTADDPRPAERPEDPNPGAAEPIAPPEPE